MRRSKERDSGKSEMVGRATRWEERDNEKSETVKRAKWKI